VQQLSHVRDLPAVQAIVRTAARELTGCDGATFVLREGDCCHYADEDAIAPLWKGKRFPMETCISGWAMRHGQSAVIPDIYADARIPHDAYRPTFVKSLVMVPIRDLDPIGAIGNYWSTTRQPDEEEVRLLQGLANATSVALENVQAYSSLEQLAQAQQATIGQLREANETLQRTESARSREEAHRRELQRELLHVSRLSTMGEFASALSHELNQPLTAASAYLQAARRIAEGSAAGDPPPLPEVLGQASVQLQRTRDIIDSIRRYIRRGGSVQQTENINGIVEEAIALTLAGLPDYGARVAFEGGQGLPAVVVDKVQIQQVLVNLLRNALEAMQGCAKRELRIVTRARDAGEVCVEVHDSGPGLPPQVREALFRPFVTTKTAGMGLGLSLCQSIVQAHGGRIWAEDGDRGGTVFAFALPTAADPEAAPQH
jgi:C4-dicarboxylate-specific signal transduction histidine kinase